MSAISKFNKMGTESFRSESVHRAENGMMHHSCLELVQKWPAYPVSLFRFKRIM
jgi:hypothetical protein